MCSHFKRHEDAQECDKGCHQISIEKKHVKSSYERLPFCYPFVVLSALSTTIRFFEKVHYFIEQRGATVVLTDKDSTPSTGAPV